MLGIFVTSENLTGTFTEDNNTRLLPNVRGLGAKNAGLKQCCCNTVKNLLTPKETRKGVIGKKNILKKICLQVGGGWLLENWGIKNYFSKKIISKGWSCKIPQHCS